MVVCFSYSRSGLTIVLEDVGQRERPSRPQGGCQGRLVTQGVRAEPLEAWVTSQAVGKDKELEQAVAKVEAEAGSGIVAVVSVTHVV